MIATALAQQPPEAPFPTLGAPGFLSSLMPGAALGSVLQGVIAFIFIIGGIVSFFYLISAGFVFISSQGDQQKLEQARNRLTWAIVGLVLLLASWGLIILVEHMTGTCFGFSCPIDLYEIGP